MVMVASVDNDVLDGIEETPATVSLKISWPIWYCFAVKNIHWGREG
jgi:hypothetical protein